MQRLKEKNNRTYTDAAYRALLDQATYSVDEKGNVTITYPDKSVDKVASAYTIQKRPVIETSLIDKADTQTPTTVSADPGSKENFTITQAMNWEKVRQMKVVELLLILQDRFQMEM